MSHWSRAAARRFVEQRSAKQLQDAKVLYDAEMVNLKAPEAWADLSEKFKRKCSEFNSEPGIGNILSFDCTDPYRLKIVRTDTQAIITVSFVDRLAVASVKGLKKDVPTLTFKVVNGSSEVALFLTKFGEGGKRQYEPVLSDDFATAVLEMFLED